MITVSNFYMITTFCVQNVYRRPIHKFAGACGSLSLQRYQMDLCGKADQINCSASFNSRIVLALDAAYGRLQHCPQKPSSGFRIGGGCTYPWWNHSVLQLFTIFHQLRQQFFQVCWD